MGQSTQGIAAATAGDERAFLRAAARLPASRGDAIAPRASAVPDTSPRWPLAVRMAASVREALAWEAETGTAFLFVPVLFGAGILAYVQVLSQLEKNPVAAEMLDEAFPDT